MVGMTNAMASLMAGIPAAWDLGSFLQNATSTLKTWGGYVIVLIGVVMVIVSVYKIAKGLMSHGQGQPTNWAVAIILLVLGGAFMVGGFTFVSGIASGGKKTIEDLGNGAIMLLPYLKCLGL